MKYNICINSKFNFDEFKSPLFNILIEGKILDSYNPIGIMPSIKINNIPFFLETMMNEKDYSTSEYSCIIFGEHEDDDGIVVIPENLVGFSIFEDRTLISKSEFYNLCLQMAEQSLEALNMFDLLKKNIVTEEWIEEINSFIPLLKDKIKSATYF